MRSLLTAAFMLAAGTALAASRPIEMQMECQQNTSDGRILVSNGDMLPREARYKIKTYRPTRNTGDGWTYGPCVLIVTKGVSD